MQIFVTAIYITLFEYQVQMALPWGKICNQILQGGDNSDAQMPCPLYLNLYIDICINQSWHDGDMKNNN